MYARLIRLSGNEKEIKQKIGYSTGTVSVSFLLIGIAKALHHFPGLEALNAFGFDHIGLQLSTLLAGVILYILLTVMSYNKACENFERIDL